MEQISWKCIPPRVCAKTLDAILNYWFFVYLWKETKQYIYKLHSREETENQIQMITLEQLVAPDSWARIIDLFVDIIAYR